MTRAFALVVLLLLAACAPHRRSYAWYMAHPDMAAKVAEGCGASRSEDCLNAEKASADAAYERRRDLYRKAF
jgi:hypothetical protein